MQGSVEALVGRAAKTFRSQRSLSISFTRRSVRSRNPTFLLASASNAVIIGFSVKVENNASTVAKREGVQVKLYSIIYELIDQVKEAMAGMLEPELRETVIGHAEVRQVFDLTKGKVAGCYVSDGRISRSARARVLRKKQPIYDGGHWNAAAFSGRRQRGSRRSGMRHQAGRFLRIPARRCHRVLHA